VRIRRSVLDAFIAAGETPVLDAGLAALDEARERLTVALSSSSAALAGEDRAELRTALDSIAQIRRRFAETLGADAAS
jgi:hypothetical protein